MNSLPQATLYDRVPYPSQARLQTHPDRLAVLGALFGLTPAPVEQCRVLELGCSDGNNLVPLACVLPASEFVGVDLASHPIATARRMAAELDLRNVRFEQRDLATLPPDYGTFDYVIAHGVFSWIPMAAQEALLAQCDAHLAPHGIAFVSYNAYPGGYLRDLVRATMRFHVQTLPDPYAQVDQAKAVLQFMADACATDDPYRAFLEHELKTVLDRQPGQLFHDDLAEQNDSFYFLEFVRRASRHGLQYLAEADFFEMFPHAFKPEAQATLERLGPDRLRREQYLDFIKCRRFRQSLLCRSTAPARPEADPAAVTRFLIRTSAQAAKPPPNLEPQTVVRFATAAGVWIDTHLPLGKAALTVLGTASPEALAFPEVFERSLDRLRAAHLDASVLEATPDLLAEFLLACYSTGVVQFHTVVPPHATVAPPRPAASPVARWQSRRGPTVTNLWHQPVRLESPGDRALLDRLDGTRDLAALAREAAVRGPDAPPAAPHTGEPAEPTNAHIQALAAALARFARLGLLLP